MVIKHFFKPLLPGFHSHLVLSLFPFFSIYVYVCLSEKLTERWVWFCVCMLLQTIPVAFLKYIEGTNGHHSAKLRSDASKITWEVKIEDGRRLTNGWKEFALAHDLRIGDILIFRQEKDMAFHVTLFGPSCCEIQYGSCLDDKNKLGEFCSVITVTLRLTFKT